MSRYDHQKVKSCYMPTIPVIQWLSSPRPLYWPRRSLHSGMASQRNGFSWYASWMNAMEGIYPIAIGTNYMERGNRQIWSWNSKCHKTTYGLIRSRLVTGRATASYHLPPRRPALLGFEPMTYAYSTWPLLVSAMEVVQLWLKLEASRCRGDPLLIICFDSTELLSEWRLSGLIVYARRKAVCVCSFTVTRIEILPVILNEVQM